jgi:ankyrin repeat protein
MTDSGDYCIRMLKATELSPQAISSKRGHKKRTLLMLASRYCKLNALRALLAHPDVDVNFQQPDGPCSTALHLAAMRGDVDVLRILLEAGASITIQDSQHRTAHDVAVAHQHVSAATLLELAVPPGFE